MNTRFQTVFASSDQAQADLMIGLLREAGLHPQDLLVNPNVNMYGCEWVYRVELPEEEMSAAQKVISLAGNA